jgi:signal recognition particle receptor subunit beta
MALVNHAKREANAKIVYFGPGLSGKTTNLNYIYRKLKSEHRGKLKSMNIQKDRMLFFDFALPDQGNVGGYDVRFHIYTLVGEVTNDAAWKMVLKGADGVVFVADSSPERMAANRESVKSLQQIMSGYGRNLADLPMVLQCNKRDAAVALSLEEMKSLSPGGCPVVPAIADKGEGVLDSLFNMVKTVVKKLRESGLELAKDAEQLSALAAGAPAARAEEPAGGGPVAHAAVPPPITEDGEVAGLQGAPAGDEEPVLAISGEPESLAGGRLRLPLSISYGGREKKVTLTVVVSVDLDEAQ